MSFKYLKTPEDLREALERQVGHLRASNAGYDEGRVAEGERIAAVLYTLFAHYMRQKALVRSAGIKSQLRFPDSRTYKSPQQEAGKLWLGPPLCTVGLDGTYLPIGADEISQAPRTAFASWWEAVVFRTASGRELSRKNLVFVLGNEDGGRHVDKALNDEAYYQLKVQGDPHLRLTDDGLRVMYWNPSWAHITGNLSIVFKAAFEAGPAYVGTSTEWPPPPEAKPFKNAHWATVRQIGREANEAFVAAGF